MFTNYGLAALIQSQPNPQQTGDQSLRISNYWQKQKVSNLSIKWFVLKNLQASMRVAVDHILLPRLTAKLSASPMGRMIETALKRRTSYGLMPLSLFGACILTIPANSTEYSMGAHKQTLRRKVRSAYRAGVSWRSITDLAEQRELMETLHRVLPDKSRYCLQGVDFRFLVGAGLWTVGFGPSGDPLLIAVTPYDGEWGLLKLFVCLGETQQHSDARYLLTQVVVEQLSALGVRYLFDTVSPYELPAGLWHFQRMIGFRTARVRVLPNDDVIDVRAPGARPIEVQKSDEWLRWQ